MAAAALAETAGWLYFAAWSFSFYPQLWLNHTRARVTGLSFDFVALNVVGFAAYSLFTVLSFVAADPEVELNDVVFAVHGLACCLIGAVQCVVFPRGAQRVRAHVAVAVAVLSACLVLGIPAAGAGLIASSVYLWFCGAVKCAITLVKYAPQVLLNYQRQSTCGWSFSAIVLDFIGGVFSVAQQLLMCCMEGNSAPITENLAKTGLGLLTLFFDSIFIYQHVCLYGHKEALPMLVDCSEMEKYPLLSKRHMVMNGASPSPRVLSVSGAPLFSSSKERLRVPGPSAALRLPRVMSAHAVPLLPNNRERLAETSPSPRVRSSLGVPPLPDGQDGYSAKEPLKRVPSPRDIQQLQYAMLALALDQA